MVFGDDRGNTVTATGVFIGVPIRIVGQKNQLVFQPDLSYGILHYKVDSPVFPEDKNSFIGLNASLKYSRMFEDGRFSIGFRSGYEATLGLYGIVIEYDHKFTENFMVGINANSQVYLGYLGESFSGVKLQATHLF